MHVFCYFLPKQVNLVFFHVELRFLFDCVFMQFNLVFILSVVKYFWIVKTLNHLEFV